MVGSFIQRSGFANLVSLIFLLVYIPAQSGTHSRSRAITKPHKGLPSYTYQETGTTRNTEFFLRSALPSLRQDSIAKTDKVSPPTTENTQQQFCTIEHPTLEAIQINEPHIIWYNTPVNGNQLPPDTGLQNNTTYYAAQLKDGNESNDRLAISVSILSLSAPTTNSPVQAFFTEDTPTVGDLQVLESNVVWYDQAVAGTLLDFDAPLSHGKSYYAALVNDICESTERLWVSVEIKETSDLKISKTVSKQQPIIGEKIMLTISVENNGSSNFKEVIIGEELDSGFKYLSKNLTHGNYDPSNNKWTIDTLDPMEKAVLTLQLETTANGQYGSNSFIESSVPKDMDPQNNSAQINLEPSCITIYNEFTPNDDGDNDYFKIECIENFPDSNLQIFNRYGTLVYQKKAYQNNWRGLANVNGVVGKGEPLPTGTYFYILNLDNTSENTTGWLFLRKD